jgi:glycosyltransferase involved in cell wall biosynthesis
MGTGRILMFINFFPPSGGGGVYRPLSFVKYLAGMGWEVTVITPRPGEYWISDPSLEDQVPTGVKVVRTGSLSAQRLMGMLKGKGKNGGSSRSSYWSEKLRRVGEVFLVPDTYIGWIPFAVREAKGLCRETRFDVVYSTGPPDSTHLAALRIAERFAIPRIADFRDPWISLYLRDPPTAVHTALHRRLERRVVSARAVLVTTDWQKEQFETLYPGCNVIKIANGFDEEDFAGPPTGPPEKWPLEIMHCGMLTLRRSCRTFLGGLSLFIERTPEAAGRLKVVFAGTRESMNEEWAGLPGLEGVVSFEDNMPHSECVARERRSHALLVIKHEDERYDGLVPGKLFEYIGARRPIIAVAPEGETSHIIKSLRRGEIAVPGDAESVAGTIEKIFRYNMEGRLDEAYDLSPLPRYSRRARAEDLGRILGEIIDGAGSGDRL